MGSDWRGFDGWTPLHHAAYEGDLALAARYLAEGHAIDARSADRLTPFHLAERAGSSDVARLLLAHGASTRLRPAPRSRQIDTLLQLPSDGPGAVVIVLHQGQVLHKKGYGLADLATKSPITPTTPFYLCSVGKQFTAMAVMLLKEQGELCYEDRLDDFFPHFRPAARHITLRQLLNHTSGLPDYLNDPLVPHATHITNRQVIALLTDHDPLFPPGDQWKYSNSGYTLLATIVERASGRPFHQFMQERIFGPLEMRNTRVYDESRPHIAGRARSYRPEGEGYCLVDYDLLTTGDGGIYSTVEDMARWDQTLYTERLVKAASLEEAFTSGRLNDGRPCGYGFGWQIGQFRGLKTVYHGGGGCGFLTWILRIPSRRFTVIALANGGKSWLGKISERIAAMYLWQHQPQPQSAPSATAD